MVTHFSGRLDELKIPQADLQRSNNIESYQLNKLRRH